MHPWPKLKISLRDKWCIFRPAMFTCREIVFCNYTFKKHLTFINFVLYLLNTAVAALCGIIITSFTSNRVSHVGNKNNQEVQRELFMDSVEFQGGFMPSDWTSLCIWRYRLGKKTITTKLRSLPVALLARTCFYHSKIVRKMQWKVQGLCVALKTY